MVSTGVNTQLRPTEDLGCLVQVWGGGMGRNHQRDANPIGVVPPRLLALIRKKKKTTQGKKRNPENLFVLLGQLFGWVNGGMHRYPCSCRLVPVHAVLLSVCANACARWCPAWVAASQRRPPCQCSYVCERRREVWMCTLCPPLHA